MHCIERGPDGSSFEQHIIHQHDDPTLDIEWHLGGLHGDHAPVGDIVAMHADINHAARDRLPPDVAQQPGQAPGEMNAAALDANQANAADVRVALGDLVGDPRQATLDRVGVEYGFSVRHSVGWGHKKTNRSGFCRFAT